MEERENIVTFQGNSLTLLGPELKLGDKAPDFRVVDLSLKMVSLADSKGMTRIICAVPSLDTPVCDDEMRRFNEEAAKLADNVTIMTVSMDLPFAQKRWCLASGVERVKVFSDYQERSFGLAYGVLIKELHLLSRAVFVVDGNDNLGYVEYVREITAEPDYAAALAAIKSEIFTQQLPGDGFCGGY